MIPHLKEAFSCFQLASTFKNKKLTHKFVAAQFLSQFQPQFLPLF